MHGIITNYDYNSYIMLRGREYVNISILQKDILFVYHLRLVRLHLLASQLYPSFYHGTV